MQYASRSVRIIDVFVNNRDKIAQMLGVGIPSETNFCSACTWFEPTVAIMRPYSIDRVRLFLLLLLCTSEYSPCLAVHKTARISITRDKISVLDDTADVYISIRNYRIFRSQLTRRDAGIPTSSRRGIPRPY